MELVVILVARLVDAAADVDRKRHRDRGLRGMSRFLIDKRRQLANRHLHRIGQSRRCAGPHCDLPFAGVSQVERDRADAREIDAGRRELGQFPRLRAHRQDRLHVGDRPGVDVIRVILAAAVLQIANAQDVAPIGGDFEKHDRIAAVQIDFRRQFAAGFVVDGEEGVKLRAGADGMHVKDDRLPAAGGESEAVDVARHINLARQSHGEDHILGLFRRVVRFLFKELGILSDHHPQRR